MQLPDTSDGLFHDGNPNTGQKGTPITAAWLNALLAVTTLLHGATEPPSSGLGADGDFYICTPTRNMYGPKTTGAWGDAWIQGLPGPRGFRWYAGNGAPGSIAGQINGDFYLDVITSDVWTMAAGTWSVIGNIRGLQGIQGPDGPAGAAFWADAITIDSSMPLSGYDVIYLGDTTTADLAWTAPTAVGKKGRQIYFENIGDTGNLLIINGINDETLDGNTTIELMCGSATTIYSDNTNWRVKKG